MAERREYNPTGGGRLGGVYRSLAQSLSPTLEAKKVKQSIGDIRTTAENIQKKSAAPYAIERVANKVQSSYPQLTALQDRSVLETATSYGIVARAFYNLVTEGTGTILDRVGLGPEGRNVQEGILGDSMYVLLQELPKSFTIAREDFLPQVTHASIQDHYLLMVNSRIPDFDIFMGSFIEAVLPEDKRSQDMQDAMTDAFVLGFMRAGNPDDDLFRGIGGPLPPRPPQGPEQPAGVPNRSRGPLGSAGAANATPHEEKRPTEEPEKRVLDPVGPSRR